MGLLVAAVTLACSLITRSGHWGQVRNIFLSHFLFSVIWLFGSVGDSNISIADSPLCFWSNFGQMSLSAKSQVYFSAPLCCTPCYVGSLQLTTLSRFLVHVYASLMQYILVLSCVVFPCFTASSASASAPTHYPGGDPQCCGRARLRYLRKR